MKLQNRKQRGACYKIGATVGAVVIAGLLSGCQSLPNGGLTYDRTQEFPAFFRHKYKLHQSHGHEFRGYDIGKRHYFR